MDARTIRVHRLPGEGAFHRQARQLTPNIMRPLEAPNSRKALVGILSLSGFEDAYGGIFIYYSRFGPLKTPTNP